MQEVKYVRTKNGIHIVLCEIIKCKSVNLDKLEKDLSAFAYAGKQIYFQLWGDEQPSFVGNIDPDKLNQVINYLSSETGAELIFIDETKIDEEDNKQYANG